MLTRWPEGFTLSVTPAFPTDFPNLTPNHLSGDISPFANDYNCFAWAASITTRRWDPTSEDGYWPKGIARGRTVHDFVNAYASIGYVECRDSSLEDGYEKIAIYEDPIGRATHAARQLKNGLWTTKFGDFEDIIHLDLKCIEGPLYGKISTFLKRLSRS